ncbi:MAG TPA: phytanoyl-CoA dioxygenase family protein [Candidatus Limnocylindrales bacterium]|nr:phytanoyl-CoA dioxygenase family protein [Candidatus Limnocylindrales bacterium]
MSQIVGAVEQYERDGFAIFRNVIDSDLVAEVDEHVRWLVAKYPDLRPEHLHHPLMRDDAFWVRLVGDERLLDIAQLFLGPDIALFTAHYICKPPGDGQPVLWHQDGAYWNLAPMEALTLWLAVDQTTSENGCLRMIPGSHRIPLERPELRTDTPNMLFSSASDSLVQKMIDSGEVVEITLNPGDVSIHHPHILHCSGPNTSPNRRCGLDMGFIRPTTRITNTGLYLDPILLRGRATPGVNNYRPWPAYAPDGTIAFRGHERWNTRMELRNLQGGFVSRADGETPIETTRRMIERLQEGTVKH